MTVASMSQHLYEFAVELRRLAYTMPGGHEDPLIHLSERMVRCARKQVAESQQWPSGAAFLSHRPHHRRRAAIGGGSSPCCLGAGWAAAVDSTVELSTRPLS
jgi:hypothetical protein